MLRLINRNYAVVVAAFIAIFSLSWWWLGARRTYVGPRTRELEVLEPDASDEVSASPPYTVHASV